MFLNYNKNNSYVNFNQIDYIIDLL